MDVRAGLQKLDDNSIDMSITSPPYWGLRSYSESETIWDGDNTCEHEWCKTIKNPKYDNRDPDTKKSQGATVGSSVSSENWAKGDLGVFCSKCGVWRGQLGLEPTSDLYIKHLCDIYDGVKRVLKNTGTCWVVIGDTYGGSGTGQKDTGKHGYSPDVMATMKGKPTTNMLSKSLVMIPYRFAIEMVNRGWVLRNTIIWTKPNAMPTSAKDRFTVDFEYLFFFAKNKKYYFEQQFEPYTKSMNRWGGETLKADGESTWDGGTGQDTYRNRNMRPNSKGKNKRTTWTINTKPFPEAHFAVYPEELIETPIKACCPRDGIVLDPFLGSGTTAVVAKKLHRNFIGFEISKEYCKIAEKRLKKTIVSKSLFEI